MENRRRGGEKHTCANKNRTRSVKHHSHWSFYSRFTRNLLYFVPERNTLVYQRSTTVRYRSSRPITIVRVHCLSRMPGQLEEAKGKLATFGMGCFWAGDSLFGVLPGVIRTCVGYAGGTKESPAYANMGDHTEVINIEYDPESVSYMHLLSLFWNNHEYGLTRKIKRQYMSLILYHDEEQKLLAEKSREQEQRKRGEVFVTEIKKFTKFYPAEDYHQKYRLQNHPWLVETMGFTTPEVLCSSPLAAKLNGYIAGAGTLEQFERELPKLGLSEKSEQYLTKYIIENQGNGLYC